MTETLHKIAHELGKASAAAKNAATCSMRGDKINTEEWRLRARTHWQQAEQLDASL